MTSCARHAACATNSNGGGGDGRRAPRTPRRMLRSTEGVTPSDEDATPEGHGPVRAPRSLGPCQNDCGFQNRRAREGRTFLFASYGTKSPLAGEGNGVGGRCRRFQRQKGPRPTSNRQRRARLLGRIQRGRAPTKLFDPNERREEGTRAGRREGRAGRGLIAAPAELGATLCFTNAAAPSRSISHTTDWSSLAALP